VHMCVHVGSAHVRVLYMCVECMHLCVGL